MDDKPKLISEFRSNQKVIFDNAKLFDENGNEVIEKCDCGNVATCWIFSLGLDKHFCHKCSHREKKTEWIKCSDRLPDENVECLIWNGSNIEIDHILHIHEMTVWANTFLEDSLQRRITHWMPLPAEPND